MHAPSVSTPPTTPVVLWQPCSRCTAAPQHTTHSALQQLYHPAAAADLVSTLPLQPEQTQGMHTASKTHLAGSNSVVATTKPHKRHPQSLLMLPRHQTASARLHKVRPWHSGGRQLQAHTLATRADASHGGAVGTEAWQALQHRPGPLHFGADSSLMLLQRTTRKGLLFFCFCSC